MTLNNMPIFIANTWGQEFSNFIFIAIITGCVIAVGVFFRDWLISVFKIKAVLDKLDEVSKKLDQASKKLDQVEKQVAKIERL